jgi:hypothetical protein
MSPVPQAVALAACVFCGWADGAGLALAGVELVNDLGKVGSQRSLDDAGDHTGLLSIIATATQAIPIANAGHTIASSIQYARHDEKPWGTEKRPARRERS